MKRLALAVVLIVGLAACAAESPGTGTELSPVSADFNAGVTAYDAGDYATALKIFDRLAEEGNAEGQSWLGWMYAEGHGAPQDYEAAARWYRKAAEQGNADAQYNLGWMYRNGKSVPQDYAEAIKWYRLAAEQGDVWAQMNLGLMYFKGEGVQKDWGEAVKWTRMAAEQGNADAMWVLGAEYFTLDAGDYVQAYMWLSLAAAHGDAAAEELRSMVAKLMTAAQIAEAERLAREWKPKTE